MTQANHIRWSCKVKKVPCCHGCSAYRFLSAQLLHTPNSCKTKFHTKSAIFLSYWQDSLTNRAKVCRPLRLNIICVLHNMLQNMQKPNKMHAWPDHRDYEKRDWAFPRPWYSVVSKRAKFCKLWHLLRKKGFWHLKCMIFCWHPWAKFAHFMSLFYQIFIFNSWHSVLTFTGANYVYIQHCHPYRVVPKGGRGPGYIYKSVNIPSTSRNTIISPKWLDVSSPPFDFTSPLHFSPHTAFCLPSPCF